MAVQMPQQEQAQHHHFILVAYPIQSHINPSLQLAKTLTRLGVQVTLSTAVSAHRLMFPDHPSSPVDDPSDPLLSYHPYSDGYDDGFDVQKDNPKDFMLSFKSVGSETLYALATTAAARRPVTYFVYALIFPWVADVASQLGVPSVLYWIQPAATFAVYHHYFHGYRELISLHAKDPSLALELPGLPPLRSRDLPTFFVGGDDPLDDFSMSLFEGTFQALDKGAERGRPRVMVNTFGSLERAVIEAMDEAVELVPIGPVLQSVNPNRSNQKETEIIKETNDEKDYMEWLDKWSDNSVVYLSFGSISILGRKQREELARTLVECGRPFLWVAREERDGVEEAKGVEHGKVVGWCNQVEVLAHRAVGCFVTHHGWNSTLEAISSGVPMVGLPQWSDQPTNAKLVEVLWGVGLRAEVNDGGVVEGRELKRCLEVVMGDGEEGMETRRRAETWKEKAREATEASDQNLKAFFRGSGLGF